MTKMKIKKVYLVKQYECCECETQCVCGDAHVIAVFIDKRKADKEAEKMYKAFVDEMEVRE